MGTTRVNPGTQISWPTSAAGEAYEPATNTSVPVLNTATGGTIAGPVTVEGLVTATSLAVGAGAPIAALGTAATQPSSAFDAAGAAAAAQAASLPLTGGTLTGPLTGTAATFSGAVAGGPATFTASIPSGVHATTGVTVEGNAYVSGQVQAETFDLGSGTVDTTLNVGAPGSEVGILALNGNGTVSGTFALSANPTTALQAAPKQYVDAGDATNAAAAAAAQATANAALPAAGGAVGTTGLTIGSSGAPGFGLYNWGQTTLEGTLYVNGVSTLAGGTTIGSSGSPSSLTVYGSLSVSAGGSLAGTFSGSPTFSGMPTFAGALYTSFNANPDDPAGTTSLPFAKTSTQGGGLAWNASGGNGEVDLYNSYGSGNTVGFWKNSATGYTQVGYIDGTGNLTLSGGVTATTEAISGTTYIDSKSVSNLDLSSTSFPPMLLFGAPGDSGEGIGSCRVTGTSYEQYSVVLFTSYTARMVILPTNGYVGIGTLSPTTALQVDGTITGTTKNFCIPYPGDPTKELIHSCLEGPENAVYYRGQSALTNGIATVALPAYFEALTLTSGRTVLLTPMFVNATDAVSNVAATAVANGQFTVKGIDQNNPSQAFFWEVKAVRSDVPQLTVIVEVASD